MNVITAKDILRQLKADLIGKDSYRGITLTYAWMANQFGHFALGFIPTLLTFSALRKYTRSSRPEFWAAIIISTGWLLFELYNFLGPLLTKRKSNSKIVFASGDKYQFHPAWGNIAFDTFTDVCFFALGAFSASVFLKFSPGVLVTICTLAGILIYPVAYWFKTKLYQQEARYPYQFRLSQWDLAISEADKKVVKEFMANEQCGNHLLIFGAEGSGKTSIAVGIATEVSIKHKACTYITAIKLFSLFFEKPGVSHHTQIWNWRDCKLLVIDDISPGKPIKEAVITAALFLELLDKYADADEDNRNTLRNKNCIWVLGSLPNVVSTENEWYLLLKNIGFNPKNIQSISLG